MSSYRSRADYEAAIAAGADPVTGSMRPRGASAPYGAVKTYGGGWAMPDMGAFDPRAGSAAPMNFPIAGMNGASMGSIPSGYGAPQVQPGRKYPGMPRTQMGPESDWGVVRGPGRGGGYLSQDYDPYSAPAQPYGPGRGFGSGPNDGGYGQPRGTKPNYGGVKSPGASRPIDYSALYR